MKARFRYKDFDILCELDFTLVHFPVRDNDFALCKGAKRL